MSLNLDERVTVKNLCEWDLYFRRIEGHGSVKFARKGINRLTRSEIQSQVFAANPMFVGTNGKGSNARLYIDDKDTRVLVGFESDDGKEKQNVLTPEKVRQIIEYKTFATFQKHVEESVKTKGEKLVFIEEAKKLKLNDHDRIKFIEEHTGYKFED